MSTEANQPGCYPTEDFRLVLSEMIGQAYTRTLNQFGPRKSTEALLMAHDTSTMKTFTMWFGAEDIGGFNLDPESEASVRKQFTDVMGAMERDHEILEGYTPVVYQFGRDGDALTGHVLMKLEGGEA